jgi:DNA repair exonuclease SbcCD nuclease subunit
MKILFTSDWQCELKNLDRCRAALDQILDIVQKQKVDCVVHCGDLKEHLNPVDVRVANFLVEAAQEITMDGVRFFVVRGNHDSITTQDGSPHVLTLLEAIGVKVISDAATKIDLGSKVYLNCVPYFRDRETQLREFTKYWKFHYDAVQILVFHNEVASCEVSPWVQGKAYTPEDLRASEYDLCIGGHIHKQQFIKPNIWYVGSPFCCDWSEANQRKGYLLLDIPDSGKNRKIEVTRIPSIIPGWYDPNVPGFVPPKSWKGTQVRSKLQIKKDPNRELAEAKVHFEQCYPGATFTLIPEFTKPSTPEEQISTDGTDEELLKRYLSKITPPPGVTTPQVTSYLAKFLPKSGLFGVQGLEFKGFKAQEALCFENVEAKLDRGGLTLVTGENLDWNNNSNGSGKSSFLSLPFIPLFGRTFKGQTFDGWSRQDSTKHSYVSQTLVLPDNRELRIIRTRRPTGLRAFLDNVEVTMGDANATQKLIEGLTNTTWEILTNSVYVGQSEIGSVFGTEKERRELFSRLLGLERFINAGEKLRRVLNRLQCTIAEVETDIESAEAAAQEVLRQGKEIGRELLNVPAPNPKKIIELKTQIEVAETAVIKREKENEKQQPWLEQNQKEFEGWLFKASEKEATIRQVREMLDKSQKVKDRCSVCGSKVAPGALLEYEEELEQKIKQAEALLEVYEAEQLTNRAQRKLVIQNIQTNQAANKTDLRSVELKRSDLQTLRQQSDARQRVEAMAERHRLRAGKLAKILQIHRDAKSAWLEDKQFLQTCINVVGRDGLPAYLCSVVAPQLNSAAERYSQLFSNSEIGIRYNLSGGEIDLEVINIHGGKNIKDQSRGEMRECALVSAFAFREVLVQHNILILDEPTEGMDADNAVRFTRALPSLVERFKNIFIVSHDANVLANLEPDHHLLVTKQNGVSTVKEIS